mmetsp:Transcript_26334/g.55987  ORF Transcript_26334/g.55987 Transcript_26334/m.55987 type:complete len:282 (+) Transcript_26334:297-1142(+)
MTLMSTASEMLLEEHIRVHVVSTLPSSSSLVIEHIFAPIVLRPHFLVRQHLVRLGYVLKHFFRLLLVLRVFVWVPLERQVPVRLLDFLLLGGPRHSQYFVIILLLALFQSSLRLLKLFLAFPLLIFRRHVERSLVRSHRLVVLLGPQLRLSQRVQSLHALLVFHVLLCLLDGLLIILQSDVRLDHLQQRRPDEGKERDVRVHGLPPVVDGLFELSLLERLVAPFVLLRYLLQDFVSLFAPFMFRIQLQTLPEMLYGHIKFCQSKVSFPPQLIRFYVLGIVL